MARGPDRSATPRRPQATDPVVPDPVRPPTALDLFRRSFPTLRRTAATLALLVPCGVLLWASSLLRPAQSLSAQGLQVLSVCECVDPVWRGALWTAAALLAALLVWSAMPRFATRPYWQAVLMLGGTAFVVAVSHRASVGPPAFVLAESATAPDGTTYRLVAHRGGGVSLVREIGRSWPLTRVDVLVWGGFREPYRLAPTDGVTGRFRVMPDGRVYVAGDGGCTIAFDPSSTGRWGVRFWQAEDRARCGTCTWPVDRTFTLFGPADRGTEADVVPVLAEIRAARVAAERRRQPPDAGDGAAEGPADSPAAPGPGAPPTPRAHTDRRFDIPTERELTDALTHPSPWVRETARRLIEEGGIEIYRDAWLRL